MSIASNLYAEKIYAEHPNALWALDEKCDFVSYISDNMESDWTNTASSIVALSSVLGINNPVTDAKINKVTTTASLLTAYTETLKSSSFSVSANSFNTSLYFYSDNAYVDQVVVSYKKGSTVYEIISTTITNSNTWYPISKTIVNTGNISIEIKIVFKNTVSGTPISYISGFSVANRSEEFASESVGVSLSSIDSSINFSGYGLKAYQYGTLNNYGYYIANNTTKVLYAKNSGMPLVYGASNSTILYENTNAPSVIVPGYGFLNEIGKYQSLVFETWLRIKSLAVDTPRRILGPISNDDGLYVYGPHLIFKIGNDTMSHYVGEWFRPMLIQIETDNGNAKLLVNGEIVASMTYSVDDLAQKYDTSKDNDYIGFYTYSDISLFEIDCVAIYPYKINQPVALRRFGYGQAAKLPENITTAYGGSQVTPDYEKSGYKNVILYPTTSWKNISYKENLSFSTSLLSTPSISKPTVVLSQTFGEDETDTSVWESDLLSQNIIEDTDNGFIKIRPNSSWSDVNGYLLIDSLNIFGSSEHIKTIYGVFIKPSTANQIEQVLMKLENSNNGDHLFISLLNNNIYYKYKIGSTSGIINSGTTSISSGELEFTVGFNFEELSLSTSVVYDLFQNIENLQLFIGGDYSGIDAEVSTTFDGKIIQIGISTENNAKNIIDNFDSNGIITDYTETISFLSHKSSYKLHNAPNIFNNSKIYKIDIACKSLATDYLGLSSFAKQTDGTYDLDFIQFNIDYPEVPISGSGYDTSKSLVKTYISFSYVSSSSEAITSADDITTTVELSSTNVVSPGSSWTNKKYEVVDGTIIYMPTSFQNGKSVLDLKINIFNELYTSGINSYPIGIRSMRLTPVSLKSTSKNLIGTKYGIINMYPLNGTQNDGYAPYAINNTNSSYLYLTNKTGIKLLDSLETNPSKKINFDINQNSSDKFFIGSINTIINFNNSEIPSTKTKLFEIKGKDATVSIFISKIDSSISNRGILTAESDLSTLSIQFYLNGIYCKNPVISINEWSSLGIVFSEPFSFSNTVGQFSISGSILVNDVSFYKIDSAKLDQQITFKNWYNIKSNPWSYYTSLTWKDVLVQSSDLDFAINPKLIHSLYTGTNKIFATSSSDLSGFKLNKYQYSVYKGGTWQQNVLPIV